MFHIWLRIEVDAVGNPDEHIAVCDSVVLGHTHTDAIASRVDHGLKMTGGVDPVVRGALGGVGCASEHSEVIAEAVGISGLGSGLALLRSVMPGVAPVGAGLSGVHQGLIDRQFWDSIGLAGLVDDLDHLLAYLQVVCQAGTVPIGWYFRSGGSSAADHQCHASTLPQRCWRR